MDVSAKTPDQPWTDSLRRGLVQDQVSTAGNGGATTVTVVDELHRHGEPLNPPREGLVRAMRPGVELRAVEDGMPTLHGHFAVFDEWTEIDSLFEGRFMERIAPGAFKKTFAESKDGIRALFQHGHDPTVGDKPLGPVDILEEDARGARYEVPLLDTSYNRDLLPGLEAGVYGASFRFRVLQEEIDNEPEASDRNPGKMPERTIKEAEVYEFGPVTFPAYAGASAGVRSLTDRYALGVEGEPDRLRELYEYLALRLGNGKGLDEALRTDDALSDGGAASEHSDEGSRKALTPLYGEGARESVPLYGHRRKAPSWRL
jgi:HK97 family phage prohead protease